MVRPPALSFLKWRPSVGRARVGSESRRSILKRCARGGQPSNVKGRYVLVVKVLGASMHVYDDDAGDARPLLTPPRPAPPRSTRPIPAGSHLRCMWYVYADRSIGRMKPKKNLDKERK